MFLRKSMAFVCAASMLCASMSGSIYAAGLVSTDSILINDNLIGTNIQITEVDENDQASNDKLYDQTTTSKGTVSCNVQTNGYDGSYHASPIRSYLYENNGFLYRLEYTGGKVILEKYNSELEYLGKGEIKPELPIFGGFFLEKITTL